MLFKNIQKLVDYAEITASTNFITIKPTIERIEEDHILPMLGSELYEAINTAYTNASAETDLTEENKKLLDKCRRVIGSYLGYYFAPIGELKFSDAGLRRSETNSEKTAYQYQVTNFREACLRNGDAATEKLLEFLFANSSTYADWENSTAFTRYSALFIKSGKDFDEFFPSHSPYRNYAAMRSKMVDVEEQYIRAAIGETLYTALKEKNKLSTPGYTEKEEKLVFKLKKAIANFTVSFAIPFLSVRIDVNGLTVATSSARTSRDADAQLQAAPDTRLAALIKQAEATAQQWLKDAIAYLDANAADFEGYTPSNPEPDEGTETEINNTLTASFALL